MLALLESQHNIYPFDSLYYRLLAIDENRVAQT
jgi:hypothetical protein